MNISFYNTIILWCFYGVIYFLPISIALLEIFSTSVIFFFLLKRSHGYVLNVREQLRLGLKFSLLTNVFNFFKAYKPVATFLNGPMAMFIAIGFFSIFISYYFDLSLQGFFFKLLEWTFLYFVFVEVFTDWKKIRNFLGIFLASGFLVALSGILQHCTKVDFIRGNPLFQERITSSFAHANDLGAYLVVAALLAYGLFLSQWIALKSIEEKRQKVFVTLSFFVFLFGLFVTGLGFTYSRGAWMAFFIGLLIFGILQRRTLILSVGVIILFLLLFYSHLASYRQAIFKTPTLHHDEVVKIQEKAADVPNVPSGKEIIISPDVSPDKTQKELTKENIVQENPQNKKKGKVNLAFITRSFASLKAFIASFKIPDRAYFWQSAFEIIKRYPLGTGLNTYSRISHEYSIFYSGYPHNCYLQLTAEMGLLGLFAFGWIILRLLMNTIRNSRLIKGTSREFVWVGVLAGIVGFLAHSFVDTNFYSVQLGNLLWIAMGILVALQKIEVEGKTKPAGNDYPEKYYRLLNTPSITRKEVGQATQRFPLLFLSRRSFQVSLLVAVVLLLRFCETHESSSCYPKALMTMARDAASKGNASLAERFYRRIIKIDPSQAEAFHGLGSIYLEKGDISKAKYYLWEAIRLDPKLHEASRDLAFLYEHNGQYALAASFFQQAMKGYPCHEYAYHAGRMYVKIGARELAIQEVNNLKAFGEAKMAETLRIYIQTNLP